MDDWEVAARIGVQATLADYAHLVDTGRLEAVAELFTESCHYDMYGGDTSKGMPLTDRAAIVAHAQQVRGMFDGNPNFSGLVRHHMTPASVQFPDASQATAASYFLTLGRSGPDHWGRYRDVLVEDGGRWRFARRVVTVEGHTPGSMAGEQS
jgi:SnoaL-like protein